jgi:anti-sigma factor RsiW
MKCPQAEVLHDLVSGELKESARAEVLAHLRGCADCKAQVREFLIIYSALQVEVASATCPTNEVLEAYNDGSLSEAEASRIRLHLEECMKCQAYTELTRATGEAPGTADREPAFWIQEGYAGEIGRATAEEALAALLPAQSGLFGLLWERISGLAQRLRSEAVEQWTLRANQGAVAGALGFAGAPDPEVMSAAIIMMTSLALAYQLQEHHIAADAAAVRTAAIVTAGRLGAGRELTTRLSDTLSAILLR